MVYIASIEDQHALIFKGPVTYAGSNPQIITSSDLNDAKELWQYLDLPKKEAEWPAIRRNAEDALQHIEAHLDPPIAGRRILDFGSGWGFFLAAAKEHGCLTHGLDPIPACGIYARAKFQLDIITDTLHRDTYPPDFFDAITSFQVFEHLPTPDQDLEILYKILRRNGIILIEVPNFETWTMRLMKSRHRHFVEDHINFFSQKTLARLMIDHGFEVLESYSSRRRMSIRHLLTFWFPKYFPASVVKPLNDRLQKTMLWETTFGINLGDIITVIARKN